MESSSSTPPPPIRGSAGDVDLPARPKSWSELRQRVRESRRQFSSSHRTPTSFVFRKLEEGKTRLYFLCLPQQGRETTIIYSDIPDEQSQRQYFPWNCLIESTFQVVPAVGKISKEEQLMWERKRCVTWGITSFELHQKTGKFIFPAASSLFGCVDHGAKHGPLFPYEIRSQCSGARLNSAMCPCNPDLVAFVCNGDIWVSNVKTGQEVRMTYCHKGLESLADDPFSAGLPPYVTQEEFNRFTGFWWRPVVGDDGVYTIAYEEVDESEIELMKFPQADGSDVEEFRFARAGTPNAYYELKLITFRLNGNEDIVDIKLMEMKTQLKHYFPYMEYLVRAGWTPEGAHIWVQLLDRRQQTLHLLLVSPHSFISLGTMANGDRSFNGKHSDNAQGIQVIYTQKSMTWVPVHDLLTFIPTNDPAHIKFIWAAEDSGWKHLYLITSNIGRLAGASPELFVESHMVPNIVEKVMLTSGEWSVVDFEKSLWVDNRLGLVYFHALMDNPLEKHLYVVSLEEPGKFRRLTPLGYSHVAQMDEDCTMFVTVFSSIQSLPGCQVFKISHTDSTIDGISISSLGWIVEPRPPDKDYQPPELFSHKISSGDKLYGMIFKPNNMQASVKYPVILSVYGGPEVQLVSNTFKGIRQMRNHLLASQGYCVVCIDSRGSQHRGQAFESHIHLRMGQVELADQVEVLQWLASVTGYLDLDRVAIHGWSYGGYLALMALVQYPNIFKISVAGAPVTAWQLYDTGYTERYMNLPGNNKEGYKLGSVLTYASEFPDEPNRLMIVHGLMDENVHFYQHTTALIAQLVKHGKPYQLQIYPGERHSLRHLEASEHYEATLLSFLQNYL